MREIKFRAWDTRHKRYVSWDEIERSRLLGVFANNHNRGISNCVLEQYTGLKDKSGVEIYEGDILRSAIGRTREVVFYQGDFQTAWKLKSPSGRLTDKGALDTAYLEIIGNIYENPGLLEAE